MNISRREFIGYAASGSVALVLSHTKSDANSHWRLKDRTLKVGNRVILRDVDPAIHLRTTPDQGGAFLLVNAREPFFERSFEVGRLTDVEAASAAYRGIVLRVVSGS